MSLEQETLNIMVVKINGGLQYAIITVTLRSNISSKHWKRLRAWP